MELPKKGRPEGVYYRKCELGLDLPAQFIYNLRGIDKNLYPIFHKYRIIWDDFVNEYVGALDDPRYSVLENSFKVGELTMGHILTNGQGIPTPEEKWHIWRWCDSVGAWAHVVKIESDTPLYLELLTKRLWLQAQYTEKYGYLKYQHLLSNADDEQRNKIMNEKRDLMQEIHKTNSALLNCAMDNFSRGKVKPTNPQKEVIMSGGGIKRRDKIVRPLKNKEAGLILPEEFYDD